MLDFVEDHENQIELIIASNYSKTLTIRKVLSNEKDITDQLLKQTNFISKRKNFLFFTRTDIYDIEKKFGKSKKLEIIFSYQCEESKGKVELYSKTWKDISQCEYLSINCLDINLFDDKTQGFGDFSQEFKKSDKKIYEEIESEKGCFLENWLEEYEDTSFGACHFLFKWIKGFGFS